MALKHTQQDPQGLSDIVCRPLPGAIQSGTISSREILADNRCLIGMFDHITQGLAPLFEAQEKAG